MTLIIVTEDVSNDKKQLINFVLNLFLSEVRCPIRQQIIEEDNFEQKLFQRSSQRGVPHRLQRELSGAGDLCPNVRRKWSNRDRRRKNVRIDLRSESRRPPEVDQVGVADPTAPPDLADPVLPAAPLSH